LSIAALFVLATNQIHHDGLTFSTAPINNSSNKPAWLFNVDYKPNADT